MNKLVETVGYMRDMMVHHNDKAMQLDDLVKKFSEDLKQATGKKKKELTAAMAQCHKEGTEAMMYAAFAESLCDVCYEVAEIKGIDIDKEVENDRIKRLKELKEKDERPTD